MPSRSPSRFCTRRTTSRPCARFRELRIVEARLPRDLVRELRAAGGNLKELRLAPLVARVTTGPELSAILAALPKGRKLRIGADRRRSRYRRLEGGGSESYPRGGCCADDRSGSTARSAVGSKSCRIPRAGPHVRLRLDRLSAHPRGELAAVRARHVAAPMAPLARVPGHARPQHHRRGRPHLRGGGEARQG